MQASGTIDAPKDENHGPNGKQTLGIADLSVHRLEWNKRDVGRDRAAPRLSMLSLLSLNDTKVDNRCLKFLAAAPSLEGLGVAGTNIDNGGVACLKDYPKLTLIGLDRTKITDRGVRYLCRSKHLTSVSFFGTAISDRSCEYLAALPELESLDVSNTAITDGGLAILATIPSLTTLNVEGTATTALFARSKVKLNGRSSKPTGTQPSTSCTDGK